MRRRPGKPGRFFLRNPDLQFCSPVLGHVAVRLCNAAAALLEVRSGAGEPLIKPIIWSRPMSMLRTLTIVAGVLAGSLGVQAAPALAAGPVKAKNVVLVHGAWADGSSWAQVIPKLQAAGLHV